MRIRKGLFGTVLGVAMTALSAGAAQVHAQAAFFTVMYVEASPKDTR